jgi:hypothetical protein
MERPASCMSWFSAVSLPVLVLLSAPDSRAADFYVDPESGSSSGDGGRESPWQTLQGVVEDAHFGADIRAGDTVWLRSGDHGEFAASGGSYEPPITVAAVAGETPELRRVSFNATKGWIVRGLSISPSYGPEPSAVDMVLVDPDSSNVAIEDCRLFSVADASAWGATEWVNLASSGIFIRGDHVRASRNTLTNVRFGISVDGPNALVEYNQIINFSADGLRGLGDDGIYQYNLVKNVYVDGDSGDDNHDDGFQSWSVGPDGPGSGVVRGVVLRGNVFLNREDPNQKLPNAMQGIGCFDGMFDDWVVENNVVITDHWHGISFYGMRNSRIVNNTVIDVNGVDPGPPWIMVTAHKDGTPSENVLVRNNLATDYDVSGTAVVDDHNMTLEDLSSFFVDPAAFDLHLLPDSPAVDSGSSEGAPELDADGIARPQGKGFDLGAYEWHEPSVEPTDGGSASGEGGGGDVATGGAAAGGSGGTAGAPGSSLPGDDDGTLAGAAGAGQAIGGATATHGEVGVAERPTITQGDAGAAGGPATGSSDDAAGCGCRQTGRRSTMAWGWALVGAVAMLGRVRRTAVVHRTAARPRASLSELLGIDSHSPVERVVLPAGRRCVAATRTD